MSTKTSPETDISERTAALRANIAARRSKSDERFAPVRAQLQTMQDEDLRAVLNRVREGLRHEPVMEEATSPGAGLPFAARTTRQTNIN